MEAVFGAYLQAGFYGSVIILLILLLRLLLRKAPRWILCLFWLLTAVRLLVPLNFESRLSLQPEVAPEQIVISFQEQPEVPAAPPAAVIPEETVPQLPQSDRVTQTKMTPTVWLSVVWAAGVVALVMYCVISFLLLKRRVSEAIKTDDGVWECEKIRGAFLLGYFKPVIYLPIGVAEADRGFVITHERKHILRGDNWWKLLGFICACVHWYNPVVWLGYTLLCRDIEIACDEDVVEGMDLQTRKAYSLALLNCGKRQSGLLTCPVAFGEVSLKQRIKNVLSYRRPGIWISLAAILLAVIVAVCFLTTPDMPAGESTLQTPDASQTTTAPVETAETSKTETTAPTEGAAAPTGEAATPTEATAAPTEGATAPTGGATAPTEGAAAPTGGATAPTGGATAPTGGATAPTEGATAPTGGATAPTGGTTAPTEGTTAPTEGATAPTQGATEPTQGTSGEEIIAGGDWDHGPLTWKITADGTLTFSGGGGIQAKSNGYIWKDYADVVRKIVLCDEIRFIPNEIFSGMYNVTSVHLGASVKEIGNSAFAGCSSLTSITIPASVTKLGTGTFYGCVSLRSVKFASGSQITVIPEEAFSNTGLTVFECPSHIKTIDFYAFSNCASLHTVILQGGALEVRRGAFENCAALKRLVVGPSVSFYRAVEGCTGLETVELYSGNVGNFNGMRMLTTAVLGGNCTDINDGMFEGCTALSQVTIAVPVTKVGNSAFENCVSLTRISLPYGVTKIGSSAFKGSGITSITIPATVQEISINTFSGSALTQIVFTGDAPVIQQTSFTGVTATAYYPAGNETWTEEVLQDYGGNITWIPQ